MSTQPATMQLRYLQTLTDIGVEKNTTIVFPLPVDLVAGMTKWGETLGKEMTKRQEDAAESTGVDDTPIEPTD